MSFGAIYDFSILSTDKQTHRQTNKRNDSVVYRVAQQLKIFMHATFEPSIFKIEQVTDLFATYTRKNVEMS